MRKSKLSILVLLVVLIAGVVAGCGGRSSAIGIVDMEKIVQNSDQLKGMQAEMQKKIAELNKEIEDAAKAGKTEEEMKQLQTAKQAELGAFGERLQNEFKESLDKYMSEVSKEKKLGAVLIKQGVAQGGIDITDDVINKMKAAQPAAPAAAK